MSVIDQVVQAVTDQHTQNDFAVIDFDNTCIENDIAEATLAYLCKHDLLRDKDSVKTFQYYYKLLADGKTLEAYKLAAEVLSSFAPEEIEPLVNKVLDEETENLGETELFGINIAKGITVRQETLDLILKLTEKNIDIWIISASTGILVAPVMKRYNIPGKLIGITNKIVNGKFTEELDEPLSVQEGKVECIKKYIDPVKRPILAAGDSMNDLPMLMYAGIKVVVNRSNALSKKAKDEGWFLLDQEPIER